MKWWTQTSAVSRENRRGRSLSQVSIFRTVAFTQEALCFVDFCSGLQLDIVP